MPFYEHVLIARQDVSSQQVEALTDTLRELIEGQGGKVVKTEYWGLRNLSYRIKKNRKGHYALMGLDAAPEAITELERQLRIHEDVLRYMTIKVDAIDEGVSPILAKKDERRRRDGADGRRDRDGVRDREASGGGGRDREAGGRDDRC
ncbi:MAG: 30S ribosomal protein S6 [Maricaulaceae bacterium]